MKTAWWCRWLLSTVSLTGILASLPVLSQPINSASDGTGTVVTPNGNRFDIQGGTLSSDRTNLFHSFQQYGNITLTGISNGTSGTEYGISLRGGGIVESLGRGEIALLGSNVNNGAEGIRIEDSSVNSTGVGSSNVTLTADEINIVNFNGFSQIRGTGILELQPLDPNLDITIGGTTTDARLNLDQSELNTLQNGFSQIFIGGDNASSAIALTGNVTFNDPITMRSPLGSGSINTIGFTLTGADDATITLLANQDITTGNIDSLSSLCK